MATQQNYKFKVIIVGGSVAGLSLAHMFERANIDYVLLEARGTISPSIGASIVIMPNGGRILDQMGLYESMKNDFMSGMARTYTRKSDGEVISSTNWPRIVKDRLGYICGICERKVFLRSIYNQLKDQSRILTGKKMLSINHNNGSVSVLCQDGSEFTGSIVVGADGIHSRTRGEMQRYAEETGPPGLMDKDRNAITAEYNCFFGIASAMPSVPEGESHVAADVDHSALVFVGKGGVPQWFFFSKMPQKYIGKANIPRYTKADMDAEVEKYGDFQAIENVTIKQLIDNTKTYSYFPLEEANHEHWTYKRIVCLGDSIHKMTPNLGQGGNQAIESAAVLTNCLVEMLTQSVTPDVQLGDIENTLLRYQKIRQKRAKALVDLSGFTTRSDALATLSHTVRYLFKPLTEDFLADFNTELYRTGPFLNFLPQPARIADNALWLDSVEKAKRHEASKPPKASQEPKARL